MSVAADPLFGEAPLASPELALVDSTLAAELRQNLSPVVDAWLRPSARVEPISVASDEDASLQLDSTHDPEEAEPRDAEQLDDPDLPWLALEEDDREGSTLHRPARVEEAPASTGARASLRPIECRGRASRSGAWRRAAARRRLHHYAARADARRRGTDEVSLSGSPRPRTRRRGDRCCRRCVSTDSRASDRDRRKTLTQAQDSPPVHTCIGSGSGLRGRGAGC